MKIGEGYLLDGCRAWICAPVVTGIAGAQKGRKNDQTDLFVHHPVMQYGNSDINEKVTRTCGREKE